MKTKNGRRPTANASQRKAALEYLKEHPGALTKEIVGPLEWDAEAGSKKLMWMCSIRELRREQVSIKCGIGNRIVRTFRYWAVVDEILPDEEVERIMEMLEEGSLEDEHEKVDLPPWHYRHDDPKRMAIKNQGGQGAARPRCSSAITEID